jgi:hypothetical protein
MNVADDRLPWWEKPYRIVQTNLRLTDASLDPEALARQVREFGATTITFNVGGIFAFYPTELPLQARNPLLTGDRTGEMLAAAHRQGLTMVGRYDLSKGTRIAYEAHPDWFVHNKDGKPQEYNGTYQACVNGGWAQDYAHRILHESLSRYDLDGAFFNMTGYQPVDYSGRHHGICWCQNCQDGFAEMFQRRLPEREDFGDPAHRDYLLFKRRTSQAAAQRIYDTVKSLRPTTGVMGNGRGACDFMRLELQRAVSRPAPQWPHQAGELTRWAAAKGRGMAYACASTNFLDYQWRFASETPHHHLLRFGQTIANGGQIDYYLLGTFAQDNAEPLEPVRKFMHWHAANEEHLWGTKSLANVALYHSRASELHAGGTATGKHRGNGFRGAYRLLLEGRIPFDFVSDERMGDADAAEQLARYDVIVLPNVACLGDEEAAALDGFVANGGTLIATGETGLYDERGRRRDRFALDSFPASRLNVAASGLETYVRIGPDELDFPKTRLLHLDGWYFHVEARDDAERLLKLLPSPKYGPPELCFPELPATESPGVLTRRFGRGRAIYLPWLPEWLYFRDGLPEHRELLLQLIGRASEPPVKLAGAGAVELTVRGKEAGDLVVHIVNYAGQRGSAYEEPPAIGGLRLGVKGGGGGAAKALVAGTTVDIGAPDADGYAWLDVPEVKYFEVVVLPAGAA